MDKTKSGGFVVIAEFQVKPGSIEAFLEIAVEDATASVRDEPGCRQFDVVRDPDSPNVVFYEVYDDRTAFDRHLETPHLARFRERFPALVERELPVRFLSLYCGAAQQVNA
jgi:quinol monooxygenase YgiN